MSKTILQECVENLSKTLARRIEERIEEGCKIETEYSSFVTIDGVCIFKPSTGAPHAGNIIIEIQSDEVRDILFDPKNLQARKDELLAEIQEIDEQLKQTKR